MVTDAKINRPAPDLRTQDRYFLLVSFAHVLAKHVKRVALESALIVNSKLVLVYDSTP